MPRWKARGCAAPILRDLVRFLLVLAVWAASGSGAAGRRILGTVVIVGMLAATVIAIFLIRRLFT